MSLDQAQGAGGIYTDAQLSEHGQPKHQPSCTTHTVTICNRLSAEGVRGQATAPLGPKVTPEL